MSKTRINYKSDLPPITVTFMVNGQEVDVPSNDFVLRFYIDGAPGTSYECSYNAKSGEYVNCEKTDDDTLVCYIDNHKFGCGRLCVEFIDLSENLKYRDGVQKTVTPSKLDIVLVEGMGDAAPNVEASVIVDLTTLIGEARTLIDTLGQYEITVDNLVSSLSTLTNVVGKKIFYYNASWLLLPTAHTEENFNALFSAIAAGASKSLVVIELESNGSYHIVNCLRSTVSGKKIVDFNYADGDTLYTGTAVLENGEVTVEVSSETFADANDVIDIQTDLADQDGRISTLETWKTNVGSLSGASYVGYSNSDSSYIGKNNLKAVLDHMISITPKYQSANWLENEEDAEHPGRRIAVRFTSMVSAINGNRLIKLYGNVATSAEVVSDSMIELSFLVTNSASLFGNGRSKIAYYTITYTEGEDYCYVEKKEIPMPYYDISSWAMTAGEGRQAMDEFINVIEQVPRCLVMAGNQPVVWASKVSDNVVKFAVMIENGMRVYTVEYDGVADITSSTYTDKTF